MLELRRFSSHKAMGCATNSLIVKPSRWWTSSKKLGIKRFIFFVVSGSSPIVVHMMVTGDLHGH